MVTGSYSLDLAGKISEPLTGRTRTYHLYPLSFAEMPKNPQDIENKYAFEELLRFGSYPYAVTTINETEKQKYLEEVINNYLYKDLLAFETVKKPKKIVDLLTMLAMQIGSQVAINELASNLAISRQAVEKYLDLLEKMFVVINIRGFSRNLRKELSKTSKYYFVDLGLRNALIRNFNPLPIRNDLGSMWENFCLIERIKHLNNNNTPGNYYFWRTYDQKEIDFIEEKEGILKAWEFKWGDPKHADNSSFKLFRATYNNSKLLTITPRNFEDFIYETTSNPLHYARKKITFGKYSKPNIRQSPSN